MKNKITVLVLIFVCSNIFAAEPVFIFPDGTAKTVIGLKYENRSIAPIVLNYYRQRHPGEIPGEDHYYYSNSALQIETSIPSVLFGSNTAGLTELDGILNIQGNDTFIPELMYFEWLNTRFLGTVFAKNYPFIYVHRLGWVYLKEELPGRYYMYSYAFESWFDLDLFQILFNMRVPQLPNEP